MSRVTDDELRAALRGALDGRRITDLRRRVSAYCTSCMIEEIEVGLEAGQALKLALKDLGWESLLAPAARVRPRFLYDPSREIAVYSHLLARASLGTPKYYAAVSRPHESQHWLLVEWLDAARLCHVGELAVWQAAADWLRGLHALPLEWAADLPLIRWDRAYYETWINRATERNPDSVVLRHLRARYGSVIERLLGLPRAIIHGEYYASNVLVVVSGNRRRVCPIDWETASIGPALMDLAALTAGQWSDTERGVMVRSYYGGDAWPGGTEEALNLCRLHQAVQWLGWPDDHWVPPADQARDWLAEAERLVEVVSL